MAEREWVEVRLYLVRNIHHQTPVTQVSYIVRYILEKEHLENSLVKCFHILLRFGRHRLKQDRERIFLDYPVIPARRTLHLEKAIAALRQFFLHLGKFIKRNVYEKI